MENINPNRYSFFLEGSNGKRVLVLEKQPVPGPGLRAGAHACFVSGVEAAELALKFLK